MDSLHIQKTITLIRIQLRANDKTVTHAATIAHNNLPNQSHFSLNSDYFFLLSSFPPSMHNFLSFILFSFFFSFLCCNRLLVNSYVHLLTYLYLYSLPYLTSIPYHYLTLPFFSYLQIL